MQLTDRRPIGRTDVEVTVMGFGGAPLGNLYAPIPDEDARGAVAAAWEAGIRYYDTAPLYGYGLSEHRFGEILRGQKRDGFVLSTKVGRVLRPWREPPAHDDKFVDAGPFEPIYDYTRDGARRSLEQSLHRLGMNRVDVLFIHDIDIFTHGANQQPDMFRQALSGAYLALREMKDEGTIAAIGVGVNEWEVCEAALDEGDFDCFLLAGRYTLLEQKPLESFLPKCVQRGASIILGGPYNSGILVTGAVKGATHNYEAAPQDILDRVAGIQTVCQAHGVPMPAAALQFPLAHPAVASVIPGGRTAAEVTQNATWLTTPVPAALWTDLKGEGLLHPDAPVPGS
ncbi:aldo/keto reductase [Marinivivus vitaminiproducens]|uniref:aldo/keto reductase n=1 Tax=Marinivivus vitaminiproducens TaxID=3035935 RepID=UPI00279C626E|nr:aldo/keto reductase [Geminicoccaceae bacterium SCSIO 64248]